MPLSRPEPLPIETSSGAACVASAASAAWARYRDNLARHLIGLARDLQLHLMNHLVVERGHRDLRPSFGLPITLIARAPRPLSELARALAISPQATSQLVALAERAGYVARRDTPQDRRARVAVLTPAGERLVGDAVACLRELEAEQAKRVGPDDHHRFVAALAMLAATLSPDRPALPHLPMHAPRAAEPVPGPASAPGSGRPSLGALPLVAAKIEQRLMHATSERGHAGLKLSHSQILTLIGPSGARLHQLAELHRVSRQAISAIAQDLETLDYLRREPDPRDRRGVVVRLTPRGLRLIADSVSALDDLDRRLRTALGVDAFDVLARVARTLYGALELETGLLSAAFPESAAGASLSSDSADAHDGLPESSRASTPAELARLAARLRDRLGSRDAARLAVHLTSMP